jgi:serine/threonine-protein kinase
VHIALPASYLGTELHGRYRLDRLIGEGASAWVFAAHDKRLERDVAIKLLKHQTILEDAQRAQRFVAEGRMLARLFHPHVVLVYDAGATRDGLNYLVMELLEAGTLEAELFRVGKLGPQQTIQLLLPLLGALACAHDRGFVHRDIKPANIVLVHESGSPRAKLLDFGIARRPDTWSSESAAGTPSYMAPEQALGQRPSAAADIWAMGVVFFRCLSGRLPFEGPSSLHTLQELVQRRAPRFADVCPDLGPHTAVALDRALERDPERRYQDMRGFAYALGAACSHDGVELPPRPEPIGLPDFAVAHLADPESTRPLGVEERGAIAVPSLVASLRARKQGKLPAVALACAAAILALTLFYPQAGSNAAAARVASRPAVIAAGAGQRSSALHAPPMQPAVAAPGVLAASPAPSPSPSESAPKPEKKRMRQRERARSPARPVTAEPAASPSPTSTKASVVRSWDW